MARKFYTSYHALVGCSQNNQSIVRFVFSGGLWSEAEVISAPPPGSDFISLAIGAATIGSARVLRTDAQNNAVIPLSCKSGIWSAGSAITLAALGNPSEVAISKDGIHALVACTSADTVNALKFNLGTGLWETNGYVSLPESNLTSIALSLDGLRAICVPEVSNKAYPLERNPSTNVWSVGSPITLGSTTTRLHSISLSPDGKVCLIGSNSNTNSDALIWNGSSWTRVGVSFKFSESKWLRDGVTILTSSGASGSSNTQVLKYDSIGHTFSQDNVMTYGGRSNMGIAVPDLGRQDIALTVQYDVNQLVPLYLNSRGWEVGTPITSSNLNGPMSVVIMPAM